MVYGSIKFLKYENNGSGQMNKTYKIVIIFLAILCILVLSVILMFSGVYFFALIHNPQTDEELFFTTITDKTGISFNSCEVVSEKNTHGGFLGDGVTEKIYNCYNKKIKEKDIKKALKPLPLSKNLNEEIMNYNSFESSIDPKLIISEITNGYYFFIDNYAFNYENKQNIYSDANLLKRPAQNYTLGIYDLDTKMFYYFEIDT